MPPLEDPDMWHEYSELEELGIHFPAVTQARVTQTLSQFVQCAPTLLSTADPMRNIETQQDTVDSQGQKEDQNTGSSPSTVDTNGRTTMVIMDGRARMYGMRAFGPVAPWVLARRLAGLLRLAL